MSWSSLISSPLPCACQNRRVRDLVTHRCNTPNGTLSFIYRQIVVSLQIPSHGDLPAFFGLDSRPLVNLARHGCDELSHGVPDPMDLEGECHWYNVSLISHQRINDKCLAHTSLCLQGSPTYMQRPRIFENQTMTDLHSLTLPLTHSDMHSPYYIMIQL